MDKILQEQCLNNIKIFLNKYDLDKLDIENFPNFIKEFKYSDIEILSSIFEINNITKWEFRSDFYKKLDSIFKKWIIAIHEDIVIEKQGTCCYILRFRNEKMFEVDLMSKNLYPKYKDIDITILDKESLFNKHKKELEKIKSYRENPNLMWILFNNKSVLKQKLHTFKRKIFYILEKKKYMEIFDKKTKKLIEENQIIEKEIEELKNYKNSSEYKSFTNIYEKIINVFEQLDFVVFDI